MKKIRKRLDWGEKIGKKSSLWYAIGLIIGML